MTQTHELACVSETLAPMTHMSRSSGNESLVMREDVVTPRGVMAVPCLSGNAIRHRCIREPGFRWLIETYGLAGDLSLEELNFLLHGGNLTEGGGRENTARIAEFQRLWPLGRLVGGTLPDQILAGNLRVWRGVLACAENQDYLRAVLPDSTVLPDRLRPAESFVTGYQYTRGDAAKTASGLATQSARDSAGDASSNLMIFAGQAVMRGAVFVHGFTLAHASTIELGALLWSLRLWQAAGGTVGGQSARGHGRLATSLLVTDGLDLDGAVDAYLDYARSVQTEAVAWLRSVFAPRPSKPAKITKKDRSAKPDAPDLLAEGDDA
ncbi:MAG: hypothetical protein AB7G11_02430 [Phycisphaerales bacterium]